MNSSINRESSAQNEANVSSRQFISLIQNYIRPVLFGHRPRIAREPWLINGTITFVSNDTRCFGITNHHVVAELRKTRAKNAEIICQIGGMRFDIDSRLIDEDKVLDLATIEFSRSEIGTIGAFPLNHSGWPVEPAKIGETAVIVGCPGELRTIDSPTQLTIPYIGLTMPIESISDTKIAFQFRRECWLVNKGCNDPAQIRDWGGISGAGAFVVRGLYPELAGVTFEYNEAFELLYCTRSDFINVDGTIRHQ